jgi:predicted metalloprotease
VSFNDNAQLDTSQVTSGGGRGRTVAVGGGVGGTIVVIVLTLLFGGNVLGNGSSAFDPTDIIQSGQGGSGPDLTQCKTGADANREADCRVVGTVNSVQDYWADAMPASLGRQYTQAKTVIYTGSTQSACGTASNAVGPFYCPTDKRVYIDSSFFDELTNRFGADSGALAQEYVVAHEYGHHVQDILGILGKAQSSATGAQSGSVRIELMADCFAGVWAKHAATTDDAGGTALLEPLTDKDVASALSAASAVGDDRIQQASSGRVNPESWTHGSSKQRQTWFLNGYDTGDPNRCDTLSGTI